MARRGATLRLRLSEARRTRLLAAATARDTTPPPPSAFKSFGAGSWIVPPARVTHPELIDIGTGVIIHEHSWLSVEPVVEGWTPSLRIGDGTLIDRLCHIACVGEVVIEDEVLIGERSLIGDTFHRFDDPTTPIIRQPLAEPAPVRIERGAHLGLAVLVMPGVTIGANSIVGAGSVVTTDVQPRSIVVGNPGRVTRRWDDDTGDWVPVSPRG